MFARERREAGLLGQAEQFLGMGDIARFDTRPTPGLGMLLRVQLLAHGQNFLIGRHIFPLVTG